MINNDYFKLKNVGNEWILEKISGERGCHRINYSQSWENILIKGSDIEKFNRHEIVIVVGVDFVADFERLVFFITAAKTLQDFINEHDDGSYTAAEYINSYTEEDAVNFIEIIEQENKSLYLKYYGELNLWE